MKLIIYNSRLAKRMLFPGYSTIMLFGIILTKRRKEECPPALIRHEQISSVQVELLNETSALLSDTKVALAKLSDVTETAATKAEGEEQARYFHDVVTVAMAELRDPVDKLEMIVDKEMWPMPSYGDLLFEV